MERTPDADPAVAPARPAGASASSEPAVAVPDPGTGTALAPQAVLHLVTKLDAAACPLWVGLAVKGSLSPSALMDQPDLTALLAAAATTGVAECEPVMLSDAATQPPRSVYLVPVPGESFRERAAWTIQLVGALRALGPQAVGLAFAADAVATPRALELLAEVLRAAIEGGMKATFHLHCGDHGINSMLNTALKLKGELEAEGHGVYVFH